MNFPGAVLCATILINLACVFGQTDQYEAEQAKQSLLSYILRLRQEMTSPQSHDLPDTPQYGHVYSNPKFRLATKVKKSPLYGMNRPMTMRQPRVASFGTFIIPNNEAANAMHMKMRYG